jgi:hypothetical protein
MPAGSLGSLKIQRLLETHGIDFRLSAATNDELAAIEPADSVLDVELDQAPLITLLTAARSVHTSTPLHKRPAYSR